MQKALTATRATAMTVAVKAPGRGTWQARHPGSGPEMLHYWASAGKSFVAVAVMQLMEEGKLALTDPISRWVENVPNGEMITVEMLLSHTSGLYSYNEDPAFRAVRRRLSATEVVTIAREHGPLFCPGTNWRYSNTGYTLLGAVIEAVEGKPLEQALTERVVARLKHGRVRTIVREDALADIASPASTTDEPAVDPRTPGASGPIAADAEGMVAFESALLQGHLVRLESLRLMYSRLYPMFGQPMSYGMGVMAYEIPSTQGDPAIWIGHSGGAPGVKAVVAYSLADNAYVAVALTGDGSAEATANLLIQALRPVQPTSEAPAEARRE
ncbi:serine hydrolase domain-containing protein [Tahibacter amnicola]|uniref:Beta-lactamase family protein n=1 Tax=Tahibacter amnicola TaxID=2976241 RepID=A0ABY6B875_9GAMM|nr:serine hydrolase domain-containing protein [Tahibacter amnicola]UXI65874.1 beta-lactamase family protein [Tahibacter amnicola]